MSNPIETIRAANASEVFSRPNAESMSLDFEQFKLYSEERVGPKNRSARLNFGERNGAPRITIFTGLDEKPKVVWAGFEPAVFWDFLDRFEEIAKGPNSKTEFIENMKALPQEPNAKGPRELVVMNKLHYGKDAEGVCWIWIEQANSPKMRFPLYSPVWHRFTEYGRVLDKKEASPRYTVAFLRALRDACKNYIGRVRVPLARDLPGKAANADGAAGSSPESFGTLDDSFFG